MAPILRLFVARGEPRLPGLLTQARNVSAATARVAGAWLGGQAVFVAAEVAAARLAACQSCPHYRPSDSRCALCGCCLGDSICAKLKLATEHCPAAPPRW